MSNQQKRHPVFRSEWFTTDDEEDIGELARYVFESVYSDLPRNFHVEDFVDLFAGQLSDYGFADFHIMKAGDTLVMRDCILASGGILTKEALIIKDGMMGHDTLRALLSHKDPNHSWAIEAVKYRMYDEADRHGFIT